MDISTPKSAKTPTTQSAALPDSNASPDIPMLCDRVEGPPVVPRVTPDPVAAMRPHNPFLPYAQLEQLAAEREKFRQELEAFTQRLKQARPPAGTKSGMPDTNELVALIAQQVLDQMRPQVEQMVSEHLKDMDNPARSKPGTRTHD